MGDKFLLGFGTKFQGQQFLHMWNYNVAMATFLQYQNGVQVWKNP